MIIEYLKTFLYGVLFGIPFCLAAGPVFFLLIQTSINKGVKYALALSFGVVLADIILINATLFSVDIIHGFILRNNDLIEIGIVVILILMGLISIFKKVNENEFQMKISKSDTSLYFIQGFILNVLNPSNFIVWLGVNSKLINYNIVQHVLFYSAAILTIATLMILISMLSKRIKQYLNPSVLKIMNISLGVIYILFAFALLFSQANLHSMV